MNKWDEHRSQTLFFLNQKDVITQTDYIIYPELENFCSACNKPLLKNPNNQDKFLNLSCGHLFCIECLQRLCSEQIKDENNDELKCPLCTHPLNDHEIDKINPQFTKIITERFAKKYGQIVSCPRCKSDFILEPGQAALITVDMNGEAIRPQALDCLRQYRVSCPICQTNFCANCKSIPFHDGFTCDENQLLDDGIVCRFCQDYPAIGCRGKDACNRVCWHQTCQDCLPQACMHVCECGHACCGIKNEQIHFGCSLCSQKVAFCIICKDSCTKSPSVLMKCGHPVHKSCIEKVYQSMKLNERIIIPRCNFDSKCQSVLYHECVKNVAEKWINISQQIEEITAMRMKIEDTQNEVDHVKNINDNDYYNQPLKFAHDFFVFYLCEKCGRPYYAGHRDCNAAENANPQNEHHICLKCNTQFVSQICPKHGETGMVIKCFFCCNPSIWFCFGTTYFCDPCHSARKDLNGPYPPCNHNCKFCRPGHDHPPNGTRTITAYCVLCEQEKENQMINK